MLCLFFCLFFRGKPRATSCAHPRRSSSPKGHFRTDFWDVDDDAKVHETNKKNPATHTHTHTLLTLTHTHAKKKQTNKQKRNPQRICLTPHGPSEYRLARNVSFSIDSLCCPAHPATPPRPLDRVVPFTSEVRNGTLRP